MNGQVPRWRLWYHTDRAWYRSRVVCYFLPRLTLLAPVRFESVPARERRHNTKWCYSGALVLSRYTVTKKKKLNKNRNTGKLGQRERRGDAMTSKSSDNCVLTQGSAARELIVPMVKEWYSPRSILAQSLSCSSSLSHSQSSDPLLPSILIIISFDI